MGRDWAMHVPMAMLSCNAFNTPNLDGYSPFELAFGQPAQLIPELCPPIPDTVATRAEAFKQLENKLKFLREKLQFLREARINKENLKREEQDFINGDLVYLFQPRGTLLQSGTRKLQAHYVGPLVIERKLDHHLYTVAALDGKLYPFVVHVSDLKPGYIKIPQGVATRLEDIVHLLRRN